MPRRTEVEIDADDPWGSLATMAKSLTKVTDRTTMVTVSVEGMLVIVGALQELKDRLDRQEAQ